MARLHLFRSEAALEAALDSLVREHGAVELGRGLTSIPRLLREATVGVSIGRAAERLLVHTAAEQFAGWSVLAPSLRPALGRAIAALRRAGVAPTALRAVAKRLPSGARGDALQLADRLERYERVLGDGLDAAGLERAALQSLARDAAPSLVEVEVVELHAPAPFDVLTRLVIEALTARGLIVRCGMPEPLTGATRWDGAIESSVNRALDVLESVAGNVERVSVTFAPAPVPIVCVAGSPSLEARAIAREVRDRIQGGLAPDEIAIAAADPIQRAQLVAALQRYGVPATGATAWTDRRVSDTAVYRLIASLLRLANEGLTRDAVAQLFGSRLLAPLRVADRTVPGSRIGAAMREALPESAQPSTWQDAFASLVQGRPESRRAEAQAIFKHVLRFRDLLATLPERAPLSRHVLALRNVLDALGVAERVNRWGRGPSPDPALPSGAAQSFEQAAWRSFDELVAALPRAARKLQLADRTYSRVEVTQLVLAAWAEASLGIGGARGAAVTVCELGKVPETPHGFIVVAGMSDEALRGSTSDPLLHDETILTLGRALDRPLFDGPDDAAHRERLALARAMSKARALWITTSRVDDGGRLLLPGAIIEWAQHRGADELVAEGLVPKLGEARTRAELATRLFVERHGVARQRECIDQATRDALFARVGSAYVAELARIERSRDAFFANERPAGPHDGQLSEAVWRRVQPGSADAPLSVTSLSTYVDCGQRFFLEKILRARPADETRDELDERAGGQLAHSALEALFSRWRDASLLPLRGRDEETTHFEPAVERAIEVWQARASIGNAVLFEQRRRGLLRLLREVWKHECASESTRMPTHFEWKFDDVVVVSAEGGAPIYLRGAVDRIDMGVGSATVFDYKAGRLKYVAPQLKEAAFGDTSWQLPLYAAVVRDRLGVDEISLVYFSLRELKVAIATAPQHVALHEGDFADKLRLQVARMRSGDFAVRPRADACRLCRMQAVCRVVERADDEAEDA